MSEDGSSYDLTLPLNKQFFYLGQSLEVSGRCNPDFMGNRYASCDAMASAGYCNIKAVYLV